MPLDNRNPLAEAVAQLAAGAAYRVIHAQLDADGGIQAEGPDGMVLQTTDLDYAGPAGYFCNPGAGEEDVVVRGRGGGGDVVVAFRIQIPADVVARAAQEPALFDHAGNRIRLNGTSGADVLMAQGKLKVHNGGTAKAVALDGDTVTVPDGSALQVWLGAVSTYCGGLTPPTTTGEVSATSTKLEVE